MEKSGRKKLAIIDASSYLYRAYYAVGPLTNSRNEPTNAIFGFLKMLNRIIKKYSPTHLAIVFDTKGPTFRHEKFEDYKAHRKPMPEDLVPQIPRLKAVLDAHNYKLFEEPGFEADDVIGTLSRLAVNHQYPSLIFSPDKDLLQLVNDDVQIVSGGKTERILHESDVIEKFGILPAQIPNLLALAGDSADGIPGIPGIGFKTASALLQQFGSIDGIYESIDTIKSNSVREKLINNRDSAAMSLELTVIQTNVDISVSFDECRICTPDAETLRKLYAELEFHDFIRDLPAAQTLKSNYGRIEDGNDLPEWLMESNHLAIAVFSDSRTAGGTLSGIALSTGTEHSTIFIPACELHKNNIKRILENIHVEKSGHDLKKSPSSLRRQTQQLPG